jgi:hypothetical protein
MVLAAHGRSLAQGAGGVILAKPGQGAGLQTFGRIWVKTQAVPLFLLPGSSSHCCRVKWGTTIMTDTKYPSRARRLASRPLLALALSLTIAGCASMTQDNPVPLAAPTQQDIADLKPSGTVTLTEVFVGGAGVGKGVLTFKGKKYPFKLAATVFGPGSVTKRQVSGEIYKLDDISQFAGLWVEGTGPVGLETSGASELWLENKAGVIMHLVGQSEGVTLSLGKDEALIELSK